MENFKNELESIKKGNNGLYEFVANNYYKLSKEELKELILNALYIASNYSYDDEDFKKYCSLVIDETIERIGDDQ